MDDIKSLREEFDRLRKQNNEAMQCADGSCEEFDEEYPDFIVEITTKMLSPARCGVYFSKKDIQFIGFKCDEKLMLQQRQRMITHILKSIFTIDEMERFNNIVKSIIDIKTAQYDELSEAFPATSEFFAPHKKQAKRFKDRLDEILEDNREHFETLEKPE